MLFQTFPFIFIYLPIVLVLYWARPGRVWKHTVLLIASYIFYGWWDYRFCGLLLLSSLVDFIVAGRIAKTGLQTKRRAWLMVSVAVNLTILGFFKYWDFFADSTNRLLELLGVGPSAPLFHIILPIGISFYTFQSMSYTIDVYRGRTQATNSLLKFLTYVSLFPQLVMGPIVRYTEVEAQLDNLPTRWNNRAMALGVNFFIVGLFKKLVIADWMFRLVDPNLYAGMTVSQFWPAFILWSFWLYYDFSSYSDMAVGMGLMLGIKFPINFDSPFQSESIREIWRRWHMTLGSWIRDYVFFPMGGSKKGFNRTLINLLIAFFLIGLWHGASWTMIGFGLYHGVGMCVEMIGARAGIKIPTRALRRFLLMVFWVNTGWLFRSDSLAMTAGFFQGAFGHNGLGHGPELVPLLVLVFCVLHTQFVPNAWRWKWRYTWWEALALIVMFMAALSRMFTEMPFFYFQF